MTSAEPELIYIFIPESIGPMDRGDKYEEPIIEEFERSGLGEVTGGGTSLGQPRADGTRPIEACGIDIDTHDVEGARGALRDLLPRLGCPEGTQLHYDVSGDPHQDEYGAGGWTIAQRRNLAN